MIIKPGSFPKCPEIRHWLGKHYFIWMSKLKDGQYETSAGSFHWALVCIVSGPVSWRQDVTQFTLNSVIFFFFTLLLIQMTDRSKTRVTQPQKYFSGWTESKCPPVDLQTESSWTSVISLHTVITKSPRKPSLDRQSTWGLESVGKSEQLDSALLWTQTGWTWVFTDQRSLNWIKEELSLKASKFKTQQNLTLLTCWSHAGGLHYSVRQHLRARRVSVTSHESAIMVEKRGQEGDVHLPQSWGISHILGPEWT